MFGHRNLSFADLENRLAYVSKNQKQRAFTLHDIFVDGDKVVVHVRFHADDSKTGKYDNDIMVIYHLDTHGQIERMFALSDIPVNYLDKP